MESLEFGGMETSVSESLSDKSMTSSTSTTCDQTVSEEEITMSGFTFDNNDEEKGDAMEDMCNVNVDQYGSDSSLDDHVYKAIIDKNCNFKTNSEQLCDEKTSFKKKIEKQTSFTFSAERTNNKSRSPTQRTSPTDQLFARTSYSAKEHHEERASYSTTPDMGCSQSSTISPTQDSRTMEIEEVGRDLGNDSLDEVSSGEMIGPSEGRESHLSVGMSDFWDGENYLSEYNYNESLDEDKARKLLSFGDDYRNFMGSMSEDQSSINANDTHGQSSKNTRRKSRKKMISGKKMLDSQSEAEIENVCNIIVASQKEILSANNVSKQVFSGGFLRKEQSQQYNELVETCSENLKLLIHLLQSIDFDNSFVSKKKCREIRALLNQWERLLGKMKDNYKKTGIYDSLKDEICTLRKDILTLIETTDNIDAQDNVANLETKLHMFKDAMMELTSFKSRLFQLNMSVHNFLAVLSNSNPLDQLQMDQAVGLKENVVELYALWDQSHHKTLGCISQTEVSLRKLDDFQKELIDLTNQLRQDSQNLRQQKKHGRAEKKNRNSSSDSGISDTSSGGFSDADISLREQQLTKLKMMASNLQVNLSSNSAALSLISQTIESTSNQMKDLHKSYLDYKKGKKKLKPGAAAKKEKKLVEKKQKQGFVGSSVRSRVVRMGLAIQMVLMLVVVLSWLCHPTCCDTYNSLSFMPQLRYIDGPPPI